MEINVKTEIPDDFTVSIKEEPIDDGSYGNPTEVTTQREVFCTTCQKSFHSTKIYQTHICKSTLDIRRMLIGQKTRIVRSKTEPKPTEMRVCNSCSFACTEDYELLIHKRFVHSDQRPYTCEICNKSFKQSSHLTCHKIMHSQDRPYSCNICKRKFKTQCNLSSHKVVHYEDNEYYCDICQRRFQRKRSLQVHKMEHGEMYYACIVCKRCIKTNDLDDHMKTHAIAVFQVGAPNNQKGEKTDGNHNKSEAALYYACTVCKKCVREDQFDEHMKSHAVTVFKLIRA